MRPKQLGWGKTVEAPFAAAERNNPHSWRGTAHGHDDLETIMVRHEEVRDHECGGSLPE
jgi:hypothetical protein